MRIIHLSPSISYGEVWIFVASQFTTLDVFMEFSAQDFAARTDIVPGKAMQLRLVLDKSGAFPFVCDVFCGSGHEQMGGNIIVTG
ncbi:MAG: hypothetical protein WCC58_08675 [Burkholderiales bacterium]